MNEWVKLSSLKYFYQVLVTMMIKCMPYPMALAIDWEHLSRNGLPGACPSCSLQYILPKFFQVSLLPRKLPQGFRHLLIYLDHITRWVGHDKPPTNKGS